jgi:hypothetical protein
MVVPAIGGITATPPQTQISSASSKQDESSSDGVSTLQLYTSPIITVDAVTGVTILEYRDPQTGDELYQIPSRVTQQYQRAQQLVR